MGAAAVKRLLKKTGTDPSEIDMLICAVVTPDMLFPATANIISDKTGVKMLLVSMLMPVVPVFFMLW